MAMKENYPSMTIIFIYRIGDFSELATIGIKSMISMGMSMKSVLSSINSLSEMSVYFGEHVEDDWLK
jgi:hypothetical protein